MRSDMSKVLVERPRHGHKDKYPRRYLKNRWGHEDDGPSREGMGGTYRTKNLNENLGPLVKFLRRNVGRPWNKVRSEMSQHIACTNIVQKHVLDHLRDFVSEHVHLAARKFVVAFSSYGGLRVLGQSRCRPDFYVCPRSGLLKLAPLLTPKRVRAIRQELRA